MGIKERRDRLLLPVAETAGCPKPDVMNSEEIRQLRKSLHMTQKELAAKVKVDAITVSRWELAKQRPRAVVLRRLNRLALNRLAKRVSKEDRGKVI